MPCIGCNRDAGYEQQGPGPARPGRFNKEALGDGTLDLEQASRRLTAFNAIGEIGLLFTPSGAFFVMSPSSKKSRITHSRTGHSTIDSSINGIASAEGRLAGKQASATIGAERDAPAGRLQPINLLGRETQGQVWKPPSQPRKC